MKSVHVSASGLRAILCGLVMVGLLVSVVTAGVFVKQGQQFKTQRLERENALLAAEVTEMRLQMESLTTSINDLATKDAQYRVIAGLPAIDEEVHQVGIGGPGTKTVASLAIRPELGEQVFAASYDLETLLRRSALLRSSMDEAIATLSANTERLEATPSISPSMGHLSSLFSKERRHPVLRITRPHQGIDIAAPVGDPISAPARGRVVYSGNRSGGYGLTVELDHGFGYVTRFAHASRLLVRVGQTVERGQTIAEVGTTGLVTGPHLHYEVEVNGAPVDPLNFIITDAIPD